MKRFFYFGLFFSAFICSSLLWAGPTIRPTESYHRYLRVLMLESQGNYVGALVELDEAIRLAPDSAYLHRMRSELLLRLGQIVEASQEIEKANQLDPTDVKAHVLAGQIYWALGNTEKAEERLKEAVALDPDGSEALLSLAGALTPKDPKEAEKLYKEFLSRHPTEIPILERLAQLYQSTNEIQKARKAWEEITELAPGYARAHLALAQIAEVNTDTTTAISHYEAVMTNDPTNLALLLRVGELRYRNNEMAKAYEAFSKAKALAPDSASANFWLAMLAENRGDWNEAIRLLEQVSENEIDPGVLLRLSYYYSQSGRHAEAVRVLKKLSRSQPTNTDFLSYLAVAYEQNNQRGEAEKTLVRITQIAPRDPEAHFHLATLYDRSKKFAKAEKELKRAIELKPDYHAALNYLGYSYADRDINLNEAEALLNSAIGLDPENPAYMDSVGWLYFRQGKLQKATDFLREAAIRTQDAVIWEHWGAVEAAKGDLVQALLCWDEALRQKSTSKEILRNRSHVFSKLSKKEKCELFVKRATDHFTDLKSVRGVVKVRVCETKPCFESKAQFGYYREDELVVEIPGPLTGPVMQLRKKHGFPAKYGAIHPQFQTAEYYATRAFDRIESVLSADVFRLIVLEDFTKNALDKNLSLTAEDGIIFVRFQGEAGSVTELEWTGEAGGDALKIGAYKTPGKNNLTAIPAFFEWTDKKSKVSFRVEFISPVITYRSEKSGDSNN